MSLASFNMLAYQARAFVLACTLETLRAAMPADPIDAEIPIAHMVGMLAEQAMALAELLAELPVELTEPSMQGGRQ